VIIYIKKYIWKDALIILYHFIIFQQVFHTFTWKTASLSHLEIIIFLHIVYFHVLSKSCDIFAWLSKRTYRLLRIYSCTYTGRCLKPEQFWRGFWRYFHYLWTIVSEILKKRYLIEVLSNIIAKNIWCFYCHENLPRKV